MTVPVIGPSAGYCLLVAGSLLLFANVGFNQLLPNTDYDPNNPNQPFNTLDNLQPRIVDGADPSGLDAEGQGFTQITGYNIHRINWNLRDRRAEEHWWHLYPFGERYFDRDMGQQARSWHNQQLDLDFFLPYYGFRFNYTFIFPEGFIAFSYPWYIQPPYTFPTPSWPNEPDPSVVAAFMCPSSFMFVGDYKISHVWYRIVSRPHNLIKQRGNAPLDSTTQQNYRREVVHRMANGQPAFKLYGGNQELKIQDGRVEDPELLDRITRDLQRGMVGARGFIADYAIIITWERMGYGGAPKQTRLDLYDQFKKWQNTFQMVIATDEIRTYSMFNYANVNWTSSTSSGALFGRGGKQSAIVGFNGGNGTGFYQMPWSAEGNSYKLAQDGSTQTAGRWQARIDEEITYGGCINTSTGMLHMDKMYATMLGGFALNVTGPCFRPGNVLKLQLFQLNIDCEKLDMVVARCVIPVNEVYQQGMVDIKLSIDGGKEYSYWNKFYLISPNQARRQVTLKGPLESWRSPNTEQLNMTWEPMNLTYSMNSQVDIALYGYWEDIERQEFREIGFIDRNVPNKGTYVFQPSRFLNMQRDMVEAGAWKKFNFGVIQVRASENVGQQSFGDGLQWSTLVPFGWFFKDQWQREYGSDWALEKCIEWFQYDGKLYNYWKDLEPTQSCPCTLDQALMDMGRFMPLYDCDMAGVSDCYFTLGSHHCVISTYAVWTGAAQECCYDTHGWLLFGQDYEYNKEWMKVYSAGVPQRAHPFGSYPFKRPPFIPAMSNYYNDLMPYEMCCKWAGHCEFFYWRRETSGCQEYKVPAAGFAYGEPHFITYDNTKYTFNGKGYFVLTMLKSPHHDLMCQIRLEQPPKTIWNAEVRATVITGVACRDNNSDTVQVFARKDFRRWRYKTDVYVDGIRIFFDTPWKKYQYFNKVMLRSPARNMNMSEIQIMFETGVGVRVMEARGILDVMVVLPENYNESLSYNLYGRGAYGQQVNPQDVRPLDKCSSYDRTMGLLGTYNGYPRDDLMSPDCTEVTVNYPPSAADSERVFREFGNKWRVDGTKHEMLFQEAHKPIYNPISFGEDNRRWIPVFEPERLPLGNASFMFGSSRDGRFGGREQIRVTCNREPSCIYDYILTGRKEIALDTLNIEQKNEGLKRMAERKWVSCGPLQKNRGVIKFPPTGNYLDGITVTFACKPEYFLHGDTSRTCINGTWSPGWWAWCRNRKLEYGLKWMTGIVVSLLFLLLIIAIFCWCYMTGVRGRKTRARHYRTAAGPPPPHQTKFQQNLEKPKPPAYDIPPPNNQKIFSVPVMESEPVKPGNGILNGRHRGSPKFSETSA